MSAEAVLSAEAGAVLAATWVGPGDGWCLAGSDLCRDARRRACSEGVSRTWTRAALVVQQTARIVAALAQIIMADPSWWPRLAHPSPAHGRSHSESAPLSPFRFTPLLPHSSPPNLPNDHTRCASARFLVFQLFYVIACTRNAFGPHHSRKSSPLQRYKSASQMSQGHTARVLPPSHPPLEQGWPQACQQHDPIGQRRRRGGRPSPRPQQSGTEELRLRAHTPLCRAPAMRADVSNTCKAVNRSLNRETCR